MVCTEAVINGIKMVLCNIYAPNKEDPNVLNGGNKVLGEMEGQIILAGGFNQVMDMFMDKSKFSGPITTRDRAALHMLCERLWLGRYLATGKSQRKGLHLLLPLSEIIL